MEATSRQSAHNGSPGAGALGLYRCPPPDIVAMASTGRSRLEGQARFLLPGSFRQLLRRYARAAADQLRCRFDLDAPRSSETIPDSAARHLDPAQRPYSGDTGFPRRPLSCLRLEAAVHCHFSFWRHLTWFYGPLMPAAIPADTVESSDIISVSSLGSSAAIFTPATEAFSA